MVMRKVVPAVKKELEQILKTEADEEKQ